MIFGIIDIGLLIKLNKTQGTKVEVILPETAHSSPNKKEKIDSEYKNIKTKKGKEETNNIIVNLLVKFNILLPSK